MTTQITAANRARLLFPLHYFKVKELHGLQPREIPKLAAAPLDGCSRHLNLILFSGAAAQVYPQPTQID